MEGVPRREGSLGEILAPPPRLHRLTASALDARAGISLAADTAPGSPGDPASVARVPRAPAVRRVAPAVARRRENPAPVSGEVHVDGAQAIRLVGGRLVHTSPDAARPHAGSHSTCKVSAEGGRHSVHVSAVASQAGGFQPPDHPCREARGAAARVLSGTCSAGWSQWRSRDLGPCPAQGARRGAFGWYVARSGMLLLGIVKDRGPRIGERQPRAKSSSPDPD